MDRSKSLAVTALLGVALFVLGGCRSASAPETETRASLQPSERADIPGPVEGTRITESYARLVARDAYFWAWPMMNIHNRRLAFSQAPEPGIMNDLPYAPLNRLAMLSDYVAPGERWVACPNQDVVYGAGILALDQSPAVVQVPDFGSRFWVYQVVDLRTDSFAELGAMYGTKPGFYLLVGPDWKGEVPAGIAHVFRATTQTGFVGPRVYQDDTPEDKQAVQPLINQIDVYPLSEFDGKMKQHDWKNIRKFPSQAEGKAETRWVFPDKFVDQLSAVLNDAKPFPGEQARYAQVLAVVAAAQKDPALKKAIVAELIEADKTLIDPLLQFRNFGLPLAAHWTTIKNGAAFGTDYFTRTAVAKSNILVNRVNETQYFYQDFDEAGERLNGRRRYRVTFPAGQTPPVKGFWSLTLYNEHHFFEPNPIGRYSVGTKNKGLQTAQDGSLTIYVQADPPSDPAQRANWLPAPRNGDFSLYVRSYWPDDTTGQWSPPPVNRDR